MTDYFETKRQAKYGNYQKQKKDSQDIKYINLWDLKKGYIFFSDVESFFKYLEDNNIRLRFITKEIYTPGDDTETILDSISKHNNTIINYTDSLHPIAMSLNNDIDSFVNPAFFEEHKSSFIAYAKHKLMEKLNDPKEVAFISVLGFLQIPDFICDDEIISVITERKDLQDVNFYCMESTSNFSLTDEQIAKIKNAHISFKIFHRFDKEETISDNIVISHYSSRSLEKYKNGTILINIPLKEEEIANFIYIDESTTISFLRPKKMNEQTYLEIIKDILNKIATISKKYKIHLTIENRETLRLSNLLNNLPSNIELSISNDNYIYDIDEYMQEEAKLEALAAPIRDSNLSPFEKYLAAYNITKNFMPYKESEEDKGKARYLRYILADDNDFIVCSGFRVLLKELLNRIHIPNKGISVRIDESYDNGFTMDETLLDMYKHARNIVRIDDPKYGIHGYYLADSTWDNNDEFDFYLNSVLTFDRKKEAYRLEELSAVDLILDFHNFDDFKKKIDYYLAREIRESKEHDESQKVIDAFKSIYETIMAHLQNLDEDKYMYFFNKYNDHFTSNNLSLSEFERTANIFLTEYANYIIPLSNNPIDSSKIIKAATNVKKYLDGYTDEALVTWLKKVKEINDLAAFSAFPYIYDPNNPTEAYLETRNPKR